MAMIKILKTSVCKEICNRKHCHFVMKQKLKFLSFQFPFNSKCYSFFKLKYSIPKFFTIQKTSFNFNIISKVKFYGHSFKLCFELFQLYQIINFILFNYNYRLVDMNQRTYTEPVDNKSRILGISLLIT